MNNLQILPFERNRYYSGKMLSSADFVLEQNYNGNKRRFLNQIMYGKGIVCGLSVYNLDDLSIMVDSGVALDSYGREMVIEETVIQKLSAIHGFEDLYTEHASLCMKYAEKEVHPVYGMKQADKEYECNHIDESFSLYLVDTEKIDDGFEMESEFLLHGNLLECNDYRLEMSVPAMVCMGKYAKILLTLTKKTAEITRFEYNGILQMPEFTSMDGSCEVPVVIEDSMLCNGESVIQEVWVRVQNNPCESASIILKPESVNANVSGEKVDYNRNFQLSIVIADINPRELVDRELGKTSLEMRGMGAKNDYVRLADITFKRNESGAVIQKIEEKVKQYIEVPSDGAIRNEYLGYYAMYSPKEKKKKAYMSDNTNSNQNNILEKRFSSGYFEIPLGKGGKKGETFFSGEVVHGLGKGNIYVDIGFEMQEQDASVGRKMKTTVYGVSDIFKDDKTPNMESAIKVMEEKGTFVAGIRFLKDYRNTMLKCRWVAVKMSDNNLEKNISLAGNSYITTEKTTINLAPGETCYIPVKFVNMESCHLCYELMEERSGEISDAGVYTAPQKSGVYEIRIYCENNPFMCTYAYAVVGNSGE